MYKKPLGQCHPGTSQPERDVRDENWAHSLAVRKLGIRKKFLRKDGPRYSPEVQCLVGSGRGRVIYVLSAHGTPAPYAAWTEAQARGSIAGMSSAGGVGKSCPISGQAGTAVGGPQR